jgi:dipeptidyl aminopeptidase/acylaminoacyl peptidase
MNKRKYSLKDCQMKHLVFLFLIIAVSISAADKRAMTSDDLWSMKRVGTTALSPDGQQIVYSLTEYDMDKNAGHTELWLVPASGGDPQQLTNHEKSSSLPRWTPDGKAVLFLSARNGSTQLYSLPMDGGSAHQLTDLPIDIDDYIISPDGQKIAFSAKVFASAKTLQESADLDKARDESPVKARVIDHLLFRAWNRWTDGKRTHVFVADLNGDNVVDITPGEFDAPPLDLGGHQDYVFSPDGSELAFVSNHTDMPAANTNNDIFLVPVTGGQAINLTQDNEAVDNQPVYSPDGRYIAYKAMQRPGFEADQYNIILYDRQSKTKVSLTEALDLSPDEVIWSPNSKTIYFNTREAGREPIYALEIKNKKITKLVSDNVNSDLDISADGHTLFFQKQSNVMPHEIFSYDVKKKKIQQITHVNKSLLAELELNPTEEFWFNTFDGAKTHALLIKPPFFDPTKKYPLMFLIHGGPQGMWSDDFHYRWNTSMFASPGYVVVAINPRGSKGYGQKWCDAVSKDWGGAPYKDLMAGLDYALDTFDFIDENKLAAAGASYGGFMINWIATQTDRFDALISHASVFDQVSMYGATEELWFPEWEFGGTPYEHPELYRKWSPSTHVKNFAQYKTPTLVIHGQGDYRVPVTQGFQMFTALQRMGVPSRLIYFPDETHFVTKPQNAKLWWSEVFAWTEKWINK